MFIIMSITTSGQHCDTLAFSKNNILMLIADSFLHDQCNGLTFIYFMCKVLLTTQMRFTVVVVTSGQTGLAVFA